MIDWDEVLEDFDWKKAVGFVGGGILLIAVVIVVGLDWHHYSSKRTLFKNDLEIIKNFQRTWKAPTTAEMESQEKSLKEWQAKMEGVHKRLPTELDVSAVVNKVRDAAARSRVQIVRLGDLPSKTDGYCLIYPVEVIFSSKSSQASANFLSEISRLPEPHGVDSQPIRLGGTNQLIVEFYTFDQAGWQEINNCRIKVTVPDIPFRDLEGVRIFKNQLADLKAKVDQESASLADVKRSFTEACELQTAVDRQKTEYEIIQEKLGA